MVTTTIDNLLLNDIKVETPPNYWCLDIQGAELRALKGASHTLQNVDAIFTEVSTDALYKGGVMMRELDEFLMERGFVRTMTCFTEKHWGDALYVRKKSA